MPKRVEYFIMKGCKNMKKIIAFLVCLSMLLGMLPATAMAAVLAESKNTNMTFAADKVYYCITPESLDDIGGWSFSSDNTADSYRSKIMYDLGNASTKKEAKTKLVLPKDGAYTIWLHTRDFASNKPGTRTFTFSVDGKEIGTGGNHGNEGWAWQSYANKLFTAGDHELVFNNKGLYSRFDLILITDDANFVPGNTEAELKALETDHLYDPSKVEVVKTDDTAGRPDTDIAVKFNGEWMNFDVPPQLINDRTMVPMRAIFEALGCSVSWNDESQTATGERNGKRVSVTIGSSNASVGGLPVTIDQSAVLINDRTLVPLRFVSEAFDAEVMWNNDTQTVTISATIPKAAFYITGESYSTYGTWIAEPATNDGASALKGTQPSESKTGAQTVTIDDADASKTKPAIAEINVTKPGKYRIWVRGRDFKTNQQGTRYFNVGVNGVMTSKTYGQHGGEGYKWEDGGVVTLKEGKNTVEVYDTSGFFARMAGIFLSEDLDYIPSDDHKTLVGIASPVDPYADVAPVDFFPIWAKKDYAAQDMATIESDSTRVNFYKVSDPEHGDFVQNEIFVKKDGAWVSVKGKTEEFGYLALNAKSAKVSDASEGYAIINTTFEKNGTEYNAMTKELYKMGAGDWLIPTSYEKTADNKVVLHFNGTDKLDFTATWEIDARKDDPKVSIHATAKEKGNYSFVLFNGTEYSDTAFDAATAPFRIVGKRVPLISSMIIEQYMATPMATITLDTSNSIVPGSYVTKGVAVDGENIEAEWVYKENSEFAIGVRGKGTGLQGVIAAPIMGASESALDAGQSYDFSYRVINRLDNWFDTYTHVAKEIYDVHDYRSNYYTSLNEAIFNTTDLMMDDMYGGWDPVDMAHYNMEGQDLTSSANPMIAIQRYLLTEDEKLLEERAIPTMAWLLTRKSRNFKRYATDGGSWKSYVSKAPSEMGSPVVDFHLGTYGGLYEMTQGGVPELMGYVNEKAMADDSGSFTAVQNDLALYKYTKDSKYLDAAKKAADKYIEETLDSETYMSQLPVWGSFINISYFPNLACFIDLYEACGDQKYLDAAKRTGEMLVTSLWTTGIDNGKGDTDYTVTADNVYNVRKFMEGHNFFWHGTKQWRLGGNYGEVRASKDGLVKLPESETVPGWLPTRVGLGLEQASTFSEALNIIMSSWAGDLVRLSKYTGEDYFETTARNAIIGRFGNYTGYYQNRYMTHQMKPRYPYEGPDYTSIYWHHIPPFLAMIEEFLITDIWYKSDAKIEFPRVRQQGYAYFYSSQYGFDSGKMYDVDGLWLWNDSGIVNPDSKQLDYLPAKKDGTLAVAFMNEDKADTTSTVTLGEKVPGGAAYSGTATVYDAAGNKSTVEVANGAFTITVPAKNILTVVMNIPEVKAPAYASSSHDSATVELGATVSEHTRGRGYTLQLNPNNYFAYVYVTDMDANDEATKDAANRIKSLTISYTVNGETKKEVRSQYPFEFIIKVDDPNAEFTYTLEGEKADGSKENFGGGTLMTAAKSAEKGAKFNGKAIPATGSATPATPSTPAKTDPKDIKVSENLPKFNPFTVKYIAQGTGSGYIRLVVKKDQIPFECTANLLAGVKASIVLKEIETGKETKVETVLAGNEVRADGNYTLLVVPTAEMPSKDYDNDKAKTHTLTVTLSMPAK